MSPLAAYASAVTGALIGIVLVLEGVSFRILLVGCVLLMVVGKLVLSLGDRVQAAMVKSGKLASADQPRTPQP
jgi:hypothetical protein